MLFYLIFLTNTLASQAAVHVAPEKRSSFFLLTEDRRLGGMVLASSSCENITPCSFMCSRDRRCKRAAFNPKRKKCSLIEDERKAGSKKLKLGPGYILMEKVDPFDVNSPPALGSSKENAVSSCKELKTARPKAKSGVYWIKHSNIRDAFQAYCDQETQGGGWTLVWSYTFTNYKDFKSDSNAITPRPNWPTPTKTPPHGGQGCGQGISVSKKVPLNETMYEAMDFALWKKLGSEFLIKSNINNWYACLPKRGSLVERCAGTVTCTKVRKVAKACWDVSPPRYLAVMPCGAALLRMDNDMRTRQYAFNADLNRGWPCHDPCGESKENQVKGVSNPHGNIFIR